MKYLLLAFLFLSACAPSSDSPSSPGVCAAQPVVGRWTNVSTGDILTINADCTGGSVSCQSSFMVGFAASNPNYALVRVSASNGAPGCLTVGDHDCDFFLSTDKNGLAVDCGGAIASYYR